MIHYSCLFLSKTNTIIKYSSYERSNRSNDGMIFARLHELAGEWQNDIRPVTRKSVATREREAQWHWKVGGRGGPQRRVYHQIDKLQPQSIQGIFMISLKMKYTFAMQLHKRTLISENIMCQTQIKKLHEKCLVSNLVTFVR